MKKGLVSVICPCYNTEKYIQRLLESVYSQTYPDIEMFVVDDGSTDNSADVIASYIPKFEERGYCLKYVRQANSGQSVAIDNGLKMINGDFLVWPDSDDYYSSNDAIAKMVARLESASPEFAMVRTQVQFVDDDTFEVISVHGLDAKEKENKSLFYDCLFNKNEFYFGAGLYMVRVSALKETTNMSIYTHKNAGQNWQLILPILYSYRCMTIKEILYTVVVRGASHSRGQYAGYEQKILRFNSYMKTILATLDRMQLLPGEEKIRLQNRVRMQYLRKFLLLDYAYMKDDAIKDRYSEMLSVDSKCIGIADRMLLFFVRSGLYKINLINKVSNSFFIRTLSHKY